MAEDCRCVGDWNVLRIIFSSTDLTWEVIPKSEPKLKGGMVKMALKQPFRNSMLGISKSGHSGCSWFVLRGHGEGISNAFPWDCLQPVLVRGLEARRSDGQQLLTFPPFLRPTTLCSVATLPFPLLLYSRCPPVFPL